MEIFERTTVVPDTEVRDVRPDDDEVATPRARVGFIGLGRQGAPMARRILDAGHPMTLWARRAASLDAFVDTGARFAASPAELAADCDVVCVCVVADADVEEVVTGADGVLVGLRPGGVVVVHSTVHPDTCRRLGVEAATQGVFVVDAPVSGGGPAAEGGRLLVMVGGDVDAVRVCRPVFETYADPVVHIGALGAGQVTKLLNNVLFTANLATAASAIALGRALGVDTGRLAQVLGHGSAAGFALGSVARAGGTLDGMGTHAGPLLLKDVRLMTDLARAANAPTGVVMRAAEAAVADMNVQP